MENASLWMEPVWDFYLTMRKNKPIVCRSEEKVDQKIERLFGKLK